MGALRDEEPREAAGELPTRLIHDGERYVTEAGAIFSRLAVWPVPQMVQPTARSSRTTSRWSPTSMASEEGTRSTVIEGRGCLFGVRETGVSSEIV